MKEESNVWRMNCIYFADEHPNESETEVITSSKVEPGFGSNFRIRVRIL